MKIISGLFMAAALLAAAPAVAATSIVTAGKLTGASGVKIGNLLYNVSFVDGSCGTVYGKCETSSFDFKNVDDALAAVSALFEQVLIGNYSRRPGDVFGCGAFTCDTYVAFGLDLGEARIAIASNRRSNQIGFDGYLPTNYSTTAEPTANFARFTLQAAAAVPEPATWAMMLIGFSMIGGAVRYRRRSTVTTYA